MKTIAAAGLAALALQQASSAFAQPAPFERCAACHFTRSGANDPGPSLVGVFGSKAGSREDFRYSRALTRSGITWDERSLNAYLKAPDLLVPGTRMAFEGIPSDAEREAIIRILKSLK